MEKEFPTVKDKSIEILVKKNLVEEAFSKILAMDIHVVHV